MGMFSRKKAAATEPEEIEEIVEELEEDKKLRDVVRQDEAETDEAPNEEVAEAYTEAQWLTEAYEGQLAVDVYQTEKEVVIVSAIAGVKPEDVDVSINNDMITIKGTRKLREPIPGDSYFLQECHWGGFSRTIILPVDVREEKVKATLQNGILEVRLEKAGREKARTIRVEGEE